MNNSLIKFAIVYNALNAAFILHMSMLQDAGIFIYSVILPVFWIISFVLYYEICIRQIKWLRKNFMRSLLVTFLCVPIFPIIILEIMPGRFLF